MKYSILILFFLIPFTAYSQRIKVRNIPEHDLKAVHFGFTLGVNTMDFRIRYSDYAVREGYFGEVSALTPGFNINIVSNFRLGWYFDLRILPGVAFGQRRIDFYRIDGPGVPGSPEWPDGNEPRFESSQELESSFIEFPFIIKYKSVRIDNYRPYLIGGVNFRYDLAKNFNEEDNIYLSLSPFDIYAESGFGIDFYLPYFKFSAELKYAIGVLNVLNPRQSRFMAYQDSIERLHSNMLVLSFHFE